MDANMRVNFIRDSHGSLEEPATIILVKSFRVLIRKVYKPCNNRSISRNFNKLLILLLLKKAQTVPVFYAIAKK